MYSNQAGGGRRWNVWKRTILRALLLSILAATAGGAAGAVCGAVLGLADGLPWACAGAWALRGVFAGFAAGAIMGALSGIYHVEEELAVPVEAGGTAGAAKPDAPQRPACRGALPQRRPHHQLTMLPQPAADATVFMDPLTLFGLAAVAAMLLFYALEHRSPAFILAFACACVLASAYGFLVPGAWPFGLVEAVWSGVALRRWWKARRRGVEGKRCESPQPCS